MSQIEKSYDLHASHYDRYFDGSELHAHAAAWLRTDIVDYWRHARLRDVIKPVLKAQPKSSWLTVGDGRLGLDAAYLLSLGANATATDLSDRLLKVAASKGLIKEFSIQNCEQMTFADNSFDYVFCKESFHHFPRPFIALSEMLRVSRSGVVLIEPQDPTIDLTPIQATVNFAISVLKRLMGRKVELHQFEDSGNYVYTISEREISKAALGVGAPAVAFKQLNDFYVAGVEYEACNPDSSLWTRVRRRVALADFLTKWGIRRGFLTAAILFKALPNDEVVQNLRSDGYQFVELPKNPYI